VRFILQFRKESKKATSANKIITSERKAKDNAREAREIKAKARKTKVDTRVDARATTIIATIIAITTNRKQLLKLRKRFVCTHVSLVFEIASILLSCLLLFNNSREYISNALYNQKLIKLLN